MATNRCSKGNSGKRKFANALRSILLNNTSGSSEEDDLQDFEIAGPPRKKNNHRIVELGKASQRVLPTLFSSKGKGRAASLKTGCKLFSYERDIICFPASFESRGNIRIPKGATREYLGRNGLIGKMIINSSMNQEQIFNEIRSIFRNAMGYRTNFQFKILQPIGGTEKSLIVPSLSNSFKWTASAVAGKNAKVPVYVLAVDNLLITNEEYDEPQTFDDVNISSADCKEEVINVNVDYDLQILSSRSPSPSPSHLPSLSPLKLRSGNILPVECSSRMCSSGTVSSNVVEPINSHQYQQSSSVGSDVVDLTYHQQLSRAIEESLLVAGGNALDPENSEVTSTSSVCDIISNLQASNGLVPPSSLAEENDDDSTWSSIAKTSIDVRRKFVVADAIREAKKSRFNPKKLLRVHFVGESGIDTGGPLREFFTLFAKNVSKLYCIKNDAGEAFFVKNVVALQKKQQEFKYIGNLTAISMVEGGPGMPIFHPAIYHYITTGEYLGLINEDSSVPYGLVRMLLCEIDNAATDDELQSIFLESSEHGHEYEMLVTETGFRRPLPFISIKHKEELKAALREYHSIIICKAEIDQFIEGLKCLDVLQTIRRYPVQLKCFFCYRKSTLDKDYFKAIFNCLFSSDPTIKEKEEATYIYFMDFLEECEEGSCHTTDNCAVTLEDVLTFFSGADKEPPLGFPTKPILTFSDHHHLAVASTCVIRLILPINHLTYQEFKEKMILSIMGNDGLGRV